MLNASRLTAWLQCVYRVECAAWIDEIDKSINDYGTGTWYNVAQNVISSSDGGSDYLTQISSKVVQYSSGTEKKLTMARNKRTTGHNSVRRCWLGGGIKHVTRDCLLQRRRRSIGWVGVEVAWSIWSRDGHRLSVLDGLTGEPRETFNSTQLINDAVDHVDSPLSHWTVIVMTMLVRTSPPVCHTTAAAAYLRSSLHFLCVQVLNKVWGDGKCFFWLWSRNFESTKYAIRTF